jgi:multicomponent Na+:H+ antiporter subunit G
VAELIGSILILLGAIFLFSAGLGMLRMPDVFTRIQAGTKASTLGNMLVLAGIAFYHPGWTLKLVIVIYFVLMTNPISSHALARAAHAVRSPTTRATVADALRDAKQSDRSST